MTIRMLLQSCRSLPSEIKALNKMLERMQSPPQGGKPHKWTKLDNRESTLEGQPTNNPNAKASQTMKRLEDELNRRKERYGDYLLAIERVLELLPNARDRAVVRYYYSLAMSLEDIANEMEVSSSTVYRRIQECVALIGNEPVPNFL